jgi:penicillin-binding protein 2
MKRKNVIRSFSGHLANYGLGQGEILTTPLQMAAYTAAIANGGTYHQPHIVRSTFNVATGKTDLLYYDSKQLPINQKYFNIVKDGM